MPEPDPPEPSCEEVCCQIHKTATDAAWATYQASGKTLADTVAYLNAVTAALAALNACLENCGGPQNP